MKKKKIVFQTGSQQRSEYGNRFRTAVEHIWAGHIGEIKTIRVGVGGSPKPCDLPAQDTPDNVDWDLWLGPAPMRAFHEDLCPKGVHNHYPAFRKYEEYAGGGLADMGAHHFGIAQWALGMDTSGPVSIEPPAEGGKGLKFTYESGVEMFHGGPSGATFEGTKGTISVDRGRLTSDPADLLKKPLPEGARRVTDSQGHMRNWLDCIKSRKDPICNVETGHRTATVCHLANLGYKLRRKTHLGPPPRRSSPATPKPTSSAHAKRARGGSIRRDLSPRRGGKILAGGRAPSLSRGDYPRNKGQKCSAPRRGARDLVSLASLPRLLAPLRGADC